MSEKQQDTPGNKLHTFKTRDGGTRTARITRSLAIKLMCTECLGFESNPRDCTAVTCPLYPFRGLTRKSRHGDRSRP